MKLTTRIERLERQLGVGVFDRMPIPVFRRWMDGTLSEEELDHWGPMIEEMLARARNEHISEQSEGPGLAR